MRRAQRIFGRAREKVGINAQATIQPLRHSFAPHLLEGMVDLTYVQELLGRSGIRTTQRYTHVGRQRVEKVKGPLDWFEEMDVIG